MNTSLFGARGVLLLWWLSGSNAFDELPGKECMMSCGLFLGTLGTLLSADLFLGVSWAQNKPPPVPPFLEGSEIALEMSYSCPSNTACSFVCPSGIRMGGAGAAGGTGAAGALGTVGGFSGADHV